MSVNKEILNLESEVAMSVNQLFRSFRVSDFFLMGIKDFVRSAEVCSLKCLSFVFIS